MGEGVECGGAVVRVWEFERALSSIGALNVLRWLPCSISSKRHFGLRGWSMIRHCGTLNTLQIFLNLDLVRDFQLE